MYHFGLTLKFSILIDTKNQIQKYIQISDIFLSWGISTLTL